MALVVEDGTGLATAQVYDEVADCSAYLSTRGLTAFAAASTEDQERALLNATEYAEEAVRTRVHGSPRSRDQALLFPRPGASVRGNDYLDSTERPILYRRGIFELAEIDVASGLSWPGSDGEIRSMSKNGHSLTMRPGGTRVKDLYPKAWRLISTVFIPARRM